ncbi:MAG: hypothetical protein J6S45_04010 [Firmicutes bacterium]|nr:hypothetical protein [Bacillota bacterium]
MKDEMNMTNHNNEDQEILQLLEMLSQLPEAPVPDEFDLRLRRALKEENKKRAAKKPVWKKWTAMAACLMIGFLSFQMIQGGVGTEMMMDAGVESEAEDIGEVAGPTAVLDAETKKNLNEVSDGLPLLQEEPILISELDGETYGLARESQLENMIGIDGETIKISRGETAVTGRESFAEDSNQAIAWIAEGIAERNSEKLVNAMNYKNAMDFSEELADKALKLYDDLFMEDAELSWKCISLTGWSRSNVYRLTDGVKNLMVIVSNTPEGLKVTEPIMEQAQWLYEQIGEQDFTLVDMIYDPETREIEFLVDLNDKKEDVRSFVWKETESL